MMHVALALALLTFAVPCAPLGAAFGAASGAPLPLKNVFSGREAAAFTILDGKGMAKVLLTATAGVKEAALTVLVLEDGAQIAEHVHETSAELLYIEDGAIEMVIDGKALKAVK